MAVLVSLLLAFFSQEAQDPGVNGLLHVTAPSSCSLSSPLLPHSPAQGKTQDSAVPPTPPPGRTDVHLGVPRQRLWVLTPAVIEDSVPRWWSGLSEPACLPWAHSARPPLPCPLSVTLVCPQEPVPTCHPLAAGHVGADLDCRRQLPPPWPLPALTWPGPQPGLCLQQL